MDGRAPLTTTILSFFLAFAPLGGSAALFPPRPALGEMLCPFPPIPLVADPFPSLEVVASALFPLPQKPGSPRAALPKQGRGAGGKGCPPDTPPFSLSFPGAAFEKLGQQEKDGAGGEILDCRLIKPDTEINKERGCVEVMPAPWPPTEAGLHSKDTELSFPLPVGSDKVSTLPEPGTPAGAARPTKNSSGAR